MRTVVFKFLFYFFDDAVYKVEADACSYEVGDGSYYGFYEVHVFCVCLLLFLIVSIRGG